MMCCVLPFALFTEALVALASWLKNFDYTPFSFWTHPEVLAVLVGPSGFVGLMMACLQCIPTVTDFSFDRSSRLLTYTESGTGRTPQTKTVRFEAIASVRALLPKTGDETGGFEVRIDRGGGNLRSMQLGCHIPIATLRQHLTWLGEELTERIESTLQLDT